MPGRFPPLPAPAAALTLAALLIGSAACGPASGPEANPVAGPQVDSSDTRAHRLADLVERSDSLTVLARALRQAGLRRELQRGGPYTLFAPTDRAFHRGRPGIDSLLVPDSLARYEPRKRPARSPDRQSAAPNRDSLRALLQFHLVRGRITADDVPDSLRVSTVLNKPLMLRRSSPRSASPQGSPSLRVFVRDRPPVRVTHTILAQNGVLHILEAPLRIPAPDTTLQDTLGTTASTKPASSSQN